MKKSLYPIIALVLLFLVAALAMQIPETTPAAAYYITRTAPPTNTPRPRPTATPQATLNPCLAQPVIVRISLLDYVELVTSR